MGTHFRLGMLPQNLVTRRPVYVPTGVGPTIGPSITDPASGPVGPVIGPIQTSGDPTVQPPTPIPPTQVTPPIDIGPPPPSVSVFDPGQGSSTTPTMPPMIPAPSGSIVGLSPLGMLAIGALGILAGVAIYNTVKHHEVKAA